MFSRERSVDPNLLVRPRMLYAAVKLPTDRRIRHPDKQLTGAVNDIRLGQRRGMRRRNRSDGKRCDFAPNTKNCCIERRRGLC